MSALMPAHAIHVFTHDSIGLGEDGPTHQPVEHLASLRYIPNNDVWRPCDAVESAVAWQRGDRAHATARPAWCSVARTWRTRRARAQQVADISRGGYVLHEPADGRFDVILIATGSEVELAMQAARQLAARA